MGQGELADPLIGARVERVRRVNKTDFMAFAQLSGDANPNHSDSVFAAQTQFGAVIAPGLLIGSYISAVIANDLPGPGSIYISQSMRFLRPVFDGDELIVSVAVTGVLRPGVYTLATTVTRGGDEVLIGEAEVKLPKPRT